MPNTIGPSAPWRYQQLPTGWLILCLKTKNKNHFKSLYGTTYWINILSLSALLNSPISTVAAVKQVLGLAIRDYNFMITLSIGYGLVVALFASFIYSNMRQIIGMQHWQPDGSSALAPNLSSSTTSSIRRDCIKNSLFSSTHNSLKLTFLISSIIDKSEKRITF